jgi:hypothetical protein
LEWGALQSLRIFTAIIQLQFYNPDNGGVRGSWRADTIVVLEQKCQQLNTEKGLAEDTGSRRVTMAQLVIISVAMHLHFPQSTTA